MTRCRSIKSRLPWLSVAVAGTLLAGCAAKSKPMPVSAVPTMEEVEGIRSAFKTSFPDAKIGVVTAVLDNEPYALVSQIETATIKESAIVSFLDAEQTVVANGRVVKVDPDGLTVQFDAGKRAPRVGDAAVKF